MSDREIAREDDEEEFDMTMNDLKLELAIQKHINHMDHISSKQISEEHTRQVGHMLPKAEERGWLEKWSNTSSPAVYTITL